MSHRQQPSQLAQHQQDEQQQQQQVIGGYRLGREIGKGSFAVVVKAYHHRTRAPAAVKVVTRKKLTTKLLENLEGEITILKSIQHPNIVELHDCIKLESHIYLIMAYCSCGDLSQYIKKRAPNSNPDLADSVQSSTFDLAHAHYQHPPDGGLHDNIVRSFLSQLASAIEFMRAMNIVHRDIKPQNLLLQHPDPRFIRAGHPHGIHQLKVADFGFARSLPAAALAETLCGSPLYMAPEILRYERYDAKADLWSVGAVLFEMAVGKAPFRAQNHIELLRKIERGDDRIKFPDERSPNSIARENARRSASGDPPLLPAHPIEDDIKLLIRSLLKRKAVERLSFEDFFRSPVIQRIEMMASVAGLEVSTTLSPSQHHHHHQHHHQSQQHTAPASLSSASSASPVSQREHSPEQVLAAAAAVAAAASGAPVPGSSSSFISAGPRQPYDQQEQQQQHPVYHQHQHTPRSNAQAVLSQPPPSLPPHQLQQQQQEEQQRQQEEDDRIYEDMQSDQVLQDVVGMTETPSGGPGTGISGGDGSGHGSTDDAYVLIEKRNVEVNALADELAQHGHIQEHHAQQQQRHHQHQHHQGFAISPSQQQQQPHQNRYYPQAPGLGAHSRSQSTSNVPLAGPSIIGLQTAGGQPSSVTSRFSQQQHQHQQPMQQLGFGVGPTGFSPSSLTGAGSQPVNIPPPPSSNDMTGAGVGAAAGGGGGGPGPSSASSSSSLARAISLASVKLFGVPTGMSLRGAAALMRMQSQRRLSTNGGSGSPAGGAGFRGGFGGLDSPVLVGQGGGVPGSGSGGAAGTADYYASASAGLLVMLEDLSQKAFVLSEFGDSRLATYFPTGPHQPPQQQQSPAGGGGSGAGGASGTVSVEMMLGDGGSAGSGAENTNTGGSSMSPAAAATVAQQLSPLAGTAAVLEPGSTPRYASRRSNSSTSISGASSPFGQQQPLAQDVYYPQQQQHASPTMQQQQQQQHGMNTGPTPAEVAATEALMLYVRALNFIQRGTDMVRTFLDVHHQQQQQQSLFSRGSLGGYPSSLPHQQQSLHTHSSSSASSTALGSNATAPTPEINEAVQWLRARFNDTYEKAEFAKARSGDMPESAQETDKLIFDRALEIARAAAVDELENNREGAGWDRTNCVLAYETAQAMLLTLLDPSEEDMALSETSMGTVEKFVRSISKRLQALRLPLTPSQA